MISWHKEKKTPVFLGVFFKIYALHLQGGPQVETSSVPPAAHFTIRLGKKSNIVQFDKYLVFPFFCVEHCICQHNPAG